MNEIFFWFGILVVCIIVMSRIPGVEHFVKPIIDLLFTGIKFIAENGVSWLIWVFKNLWSSHLETIKHLMLAPETIDPSMEVRKKEK